MDIANAEDNMHPNLHEKQLNRVELDIIHHILLPHYSYQSSHNMRFISGAMINYLCIPQVQLSSEQTIHMGQIKCSILMTKLI